MTFALYLATILFPNCLKPQSNRATCGELDAGGLVTHEDAPGELGFFWATKIGGPSHGFDYDAWLGVVVPRRLGTPRQLCLSAGML